MELDRAIGIVKKMENSSRISSERTESILAPSHKDNADALKLLIDIIESNGNALHKCKHCNHIIIGTSSRSYCNEKCRQAAFRKKNKK